nr:transposase (putative), gypsy type [Tanacetum cinerariifolium]
YDPEAKAKYLAALHALKNLKYPLVDQLEGLKDAPMDVIMASLHLESDTGDDAPQWVRELHLSSSQLTILVYWRWMIGSRLRLAVMKCGESIELRQAFADVVSAGISKGLSEGLKHEVEHGQDKLDLEAIEAYDPEAKAKYLAALHALKNLKYPLVDQLEGLKDAPMDVIMASLHLESDTGDDAPQWVRELHLSSSQLTILVYWRYVTP